MVNVRGIVNISFFAVCFLLIIWILYYFILLDRRMKRRIDFYFDTVKKSKEVSGKKISIKKVSGLKKINEIIREKLSIINQDKIDLMLKSAGMQLNPEEYIMIKWFLTAILGGILYFITNIFLLLLIGGFIGYILPKLWINRKIKIRVEKFNEGLPDMLSTIIGSLRSGYSFTQAFKTVVEECDSPVRDEITLLLKELNYGITMEDALNNLNGRMQSNDLELMVQAVLIQRQVGGNLAGVLEILVGTIRERNRIQRQVRTLTAQGRMSGRVIGSLPIVLGVVIYIMNPEYISILFTNLAGKIIVVIGVVSGIVGFILIHKLTKIEV